MVTTGEEAGQEVDLEQKLTEAWQTMLASQQAAVTFISESQKRPLDNGEVNPVAFFNNKMVSKLHNSQFKSRIVSLARARTSTGFSSMRAIQATCLPSSLAKGVNNSRTVLMDSNSLLQTVLVLMISLKRRLRTPFACLKVAARTQIF